MLEDACRHHQGHHGRGFRRRARRVGRASLSWTGIGAGISWSVAAWQCSQILKLWGEASSAIATIQTLITGFAGMATSPDEITLREITPLPMPVVGYDHLGVAPEPARPRQKGEL
ncbi:hypothetical protein [Actinophytocola sp.]|uniref:hypothetical protein n=1 Tax=Actinophytocola sp. TaxID=1872138 RepID=UPI00389A5584